MNLIQDKVSSLKKSLWEIELKMRIALVNLTHGGLSGGYRKYLEELVPLLEREPRVRSLAVFVPPEVRDSLKLNDLPLQVWPATDIKAGFPWLKKTLHHLAPDVVFIPTARWLNCDSIPVTVMIRNMEPLAVPFNGNSLAEGFKNIARAFVARKACKRANRVIAVSNYVRNYLIENWHVESQKIGVVYHGLEPVTCRENVITPKALLQQTRDRFIFTAGSLRPARGLEDVIKALGILKRRGDGIRLVIGGDVNAGTAFYRERMQRLAAQWGVADDVLWVGQLNSQEISWCFYNCAVFVMTSRAEACPNIVLEAMGHGCLSVSTTQAPMPEFFLDSANYYEAGDAEVLARQLIAVLGMGEVEKRERRSAAALRAHDFKWRATASATIAQLELAVEHHRA